MAVTFFIVEDHALMSTGIRQFLEKDGEFACAGGAETLKGAVCALRILSEKDALPDIVLLDLFLGEESSLPLLRIPDSLGVSLYTWRDATASLTKKERSVLNLLLERKTVEEISLALGLNRRTVENYQSRIYSKTGLSGRDALLSQFG